MTRPHEASAAATGIDLFLVAVVLGAMSYLTVTALRAFRRARRWPRPRKSWLRDFRAEAEKRRENGGDQ